MEIGEFTSIEITVPAHYDESARLDVEFEIAYALFPHATQEEQELIMAKIFAVPEQEPLPENTVRMTDIAAQVAEDWKSRDQGGTNAQ